MYRFAVVLNFSSSECAQIRTLHVSRKMTRMTKFADAFWETDFVGTQGFDALTKRMRIGRNTCKDLYEFFSQRASIEKDYAAKLQKLASTMEKKAHSTDESKTLDLAMAALIQQSERVASIHSEAAKAYHDRVEKLRKFSDSQKEDKKKVEENLKKSQTSKISQYNKTMSLQKNYHSKCREWDHLKSQVESASQSVTMQAKDKDKLNQKFDRAENDMTKADLAYKNSVELLEQVRVAWERDMEEACAKFQSLEESRIDFLRSDMWLHCNIMSQVCVEVDESCEQTRLELENCSIEEDIADFIMSAKTGCDRPAKIVYENYHQGGKKLPTPTGGRHPPPRPSPALPTTVAYNNISCEGDYASIN